MQRVIENEEITRWVLNVGCAQFVVGLGNRQIIIDRLFIIQFWLTPRMEHKITVSHLQSQLRNTPESTIKAITLRIFPRQSLNNIYECLFSNIEMLTTMRYEKLMSTNEIVREILKKIQQVDKELLNVLTQNFIGSLVGSIVGNVPNRRVDDLTPNRVNVLQVGNVVRMPSHISDRFYEEFNSKVQNVMNLADKHKCLCQKQILLETEAQQIYKCLHCHSYYHTNCMKRQYSCSFCFLKLMNPSIQVKKEIFVGLMRKNKKKHQMYFEIDNLSKMDNSYFQIRSIRITQTTQNFNLFQDSATITINNNIVKQLTPLHRQSSLKFRKDQPFQLPYYTLKKANKCVILQKPPSKQSREERIQPENHLFGIYQVENKTVPELIKIITENNMQDVKQSKKLLDNNFRISSEDLSCQVLKVPLTCTLSGDVIKYPARGIFCKHFQCFDLHSYLTLTASSTTLKWLCPLCKKPSYQFTIDPIIQSILMKNDKFITHAMFKIDGSFQLYAKDKLITDGVRNIFDLNAELIVKRQKDYDEQSLQQSKKNKKKIHKIEPTEVIELSD